MKTKIRFVKAWTSDDGDEFNPGDGAKVSKAFATQLIEEGFAELVEKAEQPEPDATKDITPTPDDKGTKAAGSGVSVEERLAALEAENKSLKDLVSLAAKTPATETKSFTRVIKERWEDDPSLGYGDLDSGGAGRFLLDVQELATNDLDGAREKHFRHSQKFLKDELASRPVVTSIKGVEFKAIGNDEAWSGEMSHGGALVPIEFRQDVITKPVVGPIAKDNGAMVVPVNSGSIVFPITKDFDRSSGLISGIQVFRDHERSTATAKRVEYGQFQLTPQRLSGAGHITGYQLSLNPATGTILLGEMQKAVTLTLNQESIQGDGAGEYRGVLNQPGAYSQSRATGSAIGADDLVNMYARNFNAGSAVWLAGWDSFGELMLMTKTIGVAGALVVMQNVTDGPILRIMGRPIIFNEFMPSLGSKGDIQFVDFSQYMIAESAYRKNDRTQFVRFLTDEDTFRLIQYDMADSHWPSTITNRAGFEKSPFVNLAA